MSEIKSETTARDGATAAAGPEDDAGAQGDVPPRGGSATEGDETTQSNGAAAAAGNGTSVAATADSLPPSPTAPARRVSARCGGGRGRVGAAAESGGAVDQRGGAQAAGRCGATGGFQRSAGHRRACAQQGHPQASEVGLLRHARAAAAEERAEPQGAADRPTLRADGEGGIGRRPAQAWRVGGQRAVHRPRRRSGDAVRAGQAARRPPLPAAATGVHCRYPPAPAPRRPADRRHRGCLRSRCAQVRRPLPAGQRNRTGAQGRQRGGDL